MLSVFVSGGWRVALWFHFHPHVYSWKKHTHTHTHTLTHSHTQNPKPETVHCFFCKQKHRGKKFGNFREPERKVETWPSPQIAREFRLRRRRLRRSWARGTESYEPSSLPSPPYQASHPHLIPCDQNSGKALHRVRIQLRT